MAMMRFVTILALFALSVGCTSMLLGDNSSAEKSVGKDRQQTGDTLRDEQISADVMAALSADEDLSRYGLSVRTVNGYVIISGVVGSYSARDRAIAIASSVSGPASVSYQIGVNTRL
jgi:osmotically-inducible protein OsmY